jgi:hypothetical protein
MNLKWAVLLVSLLVLLYGGLTTNTNSYELLGFLAFGLIFVGIPYTIYRTFTHSRLAILVALSSPLILGFSWSEWVGYLIKRQLEKEGIITTGVVVAAWETRTRNGGKQNLLVANFWTESGMHQTASHKNTKDFQKGDSLMIRYSVSNPDIYRIIELDN